MVQVIAVKERMHERRHTANKIPGDTKVHHGAPRHVDNLVDEDPNPKQGNSGHQQCGDLNQRKSCRHDVHSGKAVGNGQRYQEVASIDGGLGGKQILNKFFGLSEGNELGWVLRGNR